MLPPLLLLLALWALLLGGGDITPRGAEACRTGMPRFALAFALLALLGLVALVLLVLLVLVPRFGEAGT